MRKHIVYSRHFFSGIVFCTGWTILMLVISVGEKSTILETILFTLTTSFCLELAICLMIAVAAAFYQEQAQIALNDTSKMESDRLYVIRDKALDTLAGVGICCLFTLFLFLVSFAIYLVSLI